MQPTTYLLHPFRKSSTDREPPHDEGPSGETPEAGRKAGDPNFHGERCSNEPHRDAGLFRKGKQVGATLSYLVPDLMDLKAGVILDTMASHAIGALERKAALSLGASSVEGKGREGKGKHFLLAVGYACGVPSRKMV